MTARRVSLRALEAAEQEALITWADTLAPQVPPLRMLVAIPNGGLRPFNTRRGKDGKPVRYSVEAQKLRRQGARRGFPDLGLLVPAGRWHGMFVELKAEGGRVKDDQEAWLQALRAQGYHAVAVVGWTAAARAIAAYLEPLLVNAHVFGARELVALRAAVPRY